MKTKFKKYFKNLYLYLALLLVVGCIYSYESLVTLYSKEEVLNEQEQEQEPSQQQNTSSSNQTIDIFVEGCNDGDTCIVSVAGLRFRVRLAEIDAPEISKKKGEDSQPFARQSKDRLNELVRGKYVKLKQIDLDRYNRPIVEMIEVSSNIDVNLKLVEEGLAELYIGGRKNKPKNPKYNEAQLNAQKQKLGIWSVPNYLSPYDYRRLHSNSN